MVNAFLKGLGIDHVLRLCGKRPPFEEDASLERRELVGDLHHIFGGQAFAQFMHYRFHLRPGLMRGAHSHAFGQIAAPFDMKVAGALDIVGVGQDFSSSR